MRQSFVTLLAVAALFRCALGPGQPFGDRLLPSQIDRLADDALKRTPEHTHFSKDYRFEWVFFRPSKDDLYPELTERIREKLATKYRVYDSEESLPKEYVSHDGVGRAYKGGFLFSVEARRVSASEIEIEYSDYEGSLAAGRQTVRYKWNGKRWLSRTVGPLMVS